MLRRISRDCIDMARLLNCHSFPGILQLVFYGPTDVVIAVMVSSRGEKDSLKPKDCFGRHDQSRREKEELKPKDYFGAHEQSEPMGNKMNGAAWHFNFAIQ